MRYLRILLLLTVFLAGSAYLSSAPASAVGLSDPGALTRHDGELTVTTDGAVIEDLEIVGTLRIEANNVTVRNVWVYGSEFWSIYVASGSARFENVEIGHPSYPGSRGIGGDNIVATGLDIHDVEDGIKLGSNSVYSDINVHDLNSPSSGPHFDAVQVEGATRNATVKDSHLSSIGPRGIGNAAVIVMTDFGPQSNITFSNNYMEGGNYTIYVRDGGHGVPQNVSFIGNRFGRTSRYGLTSLDGPVTWENNTWADTGQLVGSDGGYITRRLAGSNRYATAAEISRSRFGSGTPVAYVATGTNFPDALAAGPVAARNRGPILLVEPNAIPSETANELSRLNPKEIVVVGGTAVVSSAVQRQLALYTTGSVTRLAGSNRYATAAEISKSAFSPGVSVVHISTGRNFPDALSASPIAALKGGPVLLVEPNAIPPETAAELVRLKPSQISIVGGTAAVNAQVQSQLERYSTGTVTRLAKANRFATAAEISRQNIKSGVATVYVATGFNFPDALAGGPVAGYRGEDVSPILLVEQNAIPYATRNELARLKPGSIVVLGGTAAVSDRVMAELAEYTSR